MMPMIVVDRSRWTKWNHNSGRCKFLRWCGQRPMAIGMTTKLSVQYQRRPMPSATSQPPRLQAGAWQTARFGLCFREADKQLITSTDKVYYVSSWQSLDSKIQSAQDEPSS